MSIFSLSTEDKFRLLDSLRKGLVVIHFSSIIASDFSTNSCFSFPFKGEPPAFDEERWHPDAKQKSFFKEQEQVEGCETGTETWQRRQTNEQPGFHA